MILRWCPFCLLDSIIGHGWRRKQAHDKSHDWIRYRRGLCPLCGVIFSFLPAFSLPYTHYSLVARSEALRRRFVERRSWENATPPLKDPNRVPDPSTLRRWFAGSTTWILLGPPFPFCAPCSKPWRSGWPAASSTLSARCPCLGQRSIPACKSTGPGHCVSEVQLFSRCPTILAWDLRPKVHTLTLGELWTPWARISNG